MLEKLRGKGPQFAEGVERLDAQLSTAAKACVQPLAGLALSAIAAGSAAWMLAHTKQLTALAKNKVPLASQKEALIYVGIAAAVVLVLTLGANIVTRVRRGRFQWLTTSNKVQRALAFMWSLPLMAALGTPKIEALNPGVTLLYIGLSALSFWPTLTLLFHKAPSSTPEPEPSGLLRTVLRVAPVLAVGALALGYAYWFSSIAITNHHAFGTRTIDLGYYDNIFYHSSHGRPLGCTLIKGGNHISAHFDPILVLMSPLYLLSQRAETILIIQSVWLSLGVIPAYLLGRRLLASRTAGVLLGFVYLCHPALHGANLYEFHSLTLIAPPVLWVLYHLEIEATKRYYASLLVLLLVREDAALLSCFIGLSALLHGSKRMRRFGWVTIAVSLAYFAFVKTFIMTSSELLNSGKGSYSFAYYFRDMIPHRTGTRGLVTSLLSNPAFVVKHILTEKKLIYLFTLLVPLGFLPLVARRGRWILLYGATFILLATRKAVYSTHFQYSMVLVPAMVAMIPEAINRLSEGGLARWTTLSTRTLRSSLLGCIVVASVLTSWKFGGAVPNATFKGGFYRPVRKMNAAQQKRWDTLKPLLAKIEPGASVTVTNRTGPHVTNRKDVYFYRHRKVTHYYFVDERELKGSLKKLHEGRLKRKVLVFMGGHGKVKLFKLDRERVEAERAEKRARKASQKRGKANQAKAAPSAASSAKNRTNAAGSPAKQAAPDRTAPTRVPRTRRALPPEPRPSPDTKGTSGR